MGVEGHGANVSKENIATWSNFDYQFCFIASNLETREHNPQGLEVEYPISNGQKPWTKLKLETLSLRNTIVFSSK